MAFVFLLGNFFIICPKVSARLPVRKSMIINYHNPFAKETLDFAIFQSNVYYSYVIGKILRIGEPLLW
jgi:hypothetical protein